MPHPRRRLVCWMLAAAVSMTLAADAWAREAVVTTKDNRQYTGEVVADNENGVVLLISGIRTVVKREDIQSVEYKKTIEEQYQDRRGAIADENLEERYNLARWLFEERAYTLALAELESMSARFPDDARVKHLKPLVEARLKLAEESASTPAVSPQPAPPPASTSSTAPPLRPDRPPAPPAAASKPLVPLPDTRLTPEQINLLKVYEVRLEDRPSVVVPQQVINEVMEKYSADPAIPKGRNDQNALRRAPGWQQLGVMFQVKAREYYPMVTVRSDPFSVGLFRTGIHRRYVLPYCGSTDCHGGENAGDFFLFLLRPNDEDTVYTNFYILTQYRNAQGQMVDREKPDMSLLVQYALPRTDAEYPHPPVPGWAAHFRTRQDPRIDPVLAWLNELTPPAPRYPISYELPSTKSRTEVLPVDESAPLPLPTPPPSAPATP